MLPRFICALATILFLLTPSRAATPLWQADPSTPSSWFDPANWSTNTLPTSTDSPQINSGQALISTGSATASTLYLSYNPGNTSSLSLTGGQLTTTNYTYVGYNGDASVTQSAGTLTGYSLYLGYGPKSAGSYTLTNLSTLSFPSETIGQLSSASFIQTGGSNINSSLYLASSNSSYATYNLSAGNLNSSLEFIGNGGTAVFSQSGGANQMFGGSLYVGYNSGSGTYNLLGNSTLQASEEYIGTQGFGSFVQTSGANFVSSSIYIDGTYILSGGQLNDYSSTHLAYGTSSTASFTQTGGTFNTNTQTFYLAEGTNGSYASYSLSDGSLLTGTQYLGYNGWASFTQSGGLNRAGAFYLAFNGIASYSLSDNAFLSTGNQYHASNSNARSTFTQSGGTNNLSTAFLYLAYGSASTSTYSLSAGNLFSSTQYIGYNGNALFTQSGGTNDLGSANLYLSYNSTAANSSYSLSAGSLLAANEYLGYNGAALFTQSGGTNDVSAGSLFLGYLNSNAKSTYLLSGSSATLLANSEDIGSASPSLFRQSAGSNTTFTLTIHPLSTYELSGGSLQISSSLSNSGSLNLFAGSLSSPSLTGTGATSLSSGFSLVIPYLRQSSLSLAGSLKLTSPSSDSLLSSLTILPAGTLDLTTSTLLLNYTTSSPTDYIRQLLQNHSLFTTSSNSSHTLAYFELSLLPTTDARRTAALSAGADTTTLLITLALIGDANLDGKLTSDDYVILDKSFSQHLTDATWTQGDFNYDGVVDQSDYLLLDTAFLSAQSPGFNPASLLSQRESQFSDAYVQQLLTYLPDPASPLICLFATFLLLRPLTRNSIYSPPPAATPASSTN
jgi:hypothetical protein